MASHALAFARERDLVGPQQVRSARRAAGCRLRVPAGGGPASKELRLFGLARMDHGQCGFLASRSYWRQGTVVRLSYRITYLVPPGQEGQGTRRGASARSWLRGVLLLSVCLYMLCLGVQAQDPRGTLVGVVQDSNGGRVPSADIVVRAAGSTLERQATTDPFGNFRLDELCRRATIKSPRRATGFAEARAELAIMVSTVQGLTVTMRPAAFAQTVNVKGRASSITTQPIDTTGTVHQGVVSAPGSSGYSAGAPHLCQYLLSRSRDRAGGTLGPHQGAHHRRLIRRQFGPERSALRRWRRQFR